MANKVPPLPTPITFSPGGGPYEYLVAAAQNAQMAGAFAGQLLTYAGDVTKNLPVINPVFPSGGPPPTLTYSTMSGLIQFTWDDYAFPDPFDKGLDLGDWMPEPFDQTGPTLNFDTKPGAFTDAAPPSPGIDTNFAFPADPELNFPGVPGLLSIQNHTFDGVTIPEFVEEVGPLVIDDPTIVNYVPGQGYTSSLLTDLDNKISLRLDGFTAMPPEVEQAIWDRGRDREIKQLQDGLDDLERMESLGYALPPGIWLDTRTKLQTEYAANSYGHSREVMIKQAELLQQNVRHAIDSAIALESRLIEQYNQIETRTLEGAKYRTNAAVEIYNAKVRAYSAYLDAYKTKAAIYEARIRGLMATVEAYKAEIQAEEIKAQVNTALVQQYKTQIDAQMALVELFKAELSAVQTKASIEKLKIDIYGEQVKAYVGKINAYTAQIEAFKASVSAEGTKQEAYKSSVEAYSAKVNAQVSVVNAKIKEFEGNLKAKEIEYEAFKARVSAQSEKVKGEAAFNSATAEGYKALVSGESAYNTALTKQWQVSLDQAQRVSEIANNAAKMNADLYMQSKAISAEAAKVGAQVYAQITAACLNALNWSTSFNVSNSTGNSSSDSYSENHTFSSST